MPNGGVPMHMILYPKDDSPYVIYSNAGRLDFHSKDERDSHKAEGTPLVRLTEAEGAAVAWFLKYWLGDSALKPGYNMPRQANAEFDF